MPMTVFWSDRLEELAQNLFARAAQRKDPFEIECTVVGNPVMRGWLKLFFLYEMPKSMKQAKVLANWEFQLLHPFVNDWLTKSDKRENNGRGSASEHPYYSQGALQWRIWNLLLASNADQYKVLQQYIGEDQSIRESKCWALAGKLAQMFDDYQNYRPEMLDCWQKERRSREPEEGQKWQPVMWRALVQEAPETYLEQFRDMSRRLAENEIEKAYQRLSVFHISAMPKAYMQFFNEVAKVIPVELYLFNPSQEFWIDDPTVKQSLKALATNDEIAWMTPPHPLLSGFGCGIQSLLATVLDATDGQVNEAAWGADVAQTLLQQVQQNIRHREDDKTGMSARDDSIQIHVCHSPMREVEVVKDLILKWFDEHQNALPHDVQVLTPNFEAYAPFIEAVFKVNDFDPHLPCVLSRRPPVSSGSVGAAYLRLLLINESRMTASDVMELLGVEPIREAYGLTSDDVSRLRRLVESAGIRWGRDAAQMKAVLDGSGMPDTVSWRRGLDRLLAGFALGRQASGDDAVLIDAGELGDLLVCDDVEGDTAQLVGKLGRFYQDLCETADRLSGECKVSQWAEFYAAIVSRFFRSTEASFAEIADIQRAIRSCSRSASVAGDPAVSSKVVSLALKSHLGTMTATGNCAASAVLFTPLNTMMVTPRKLIVVMGLNEGDFPRANDRAAFDLISQRPHYGDRSLRHEDRLAFLEGVMCARERLILTYTGFNIANNNKIPPSPAVTEFVQYLEERVPITEHKLHAFHPAYFQQDSPFVSYVPENYEAAKVWAATTRKQETPDEKTDEASLSKMEVQNDLAAAFTGATEKPVITQAELAAFFRNPARFYYTQILQVRLTEPHKESLEDSELFEMDALDSYKLNNILIAEILKVREDDPGSASPSEPANATLTRLQEQALLPMGNYGVEKARELWQELGDFLSHPVSILENTTYGDLFELANRTTAIGVTAALEAALVSGNLPLITVKSAKYMVQYRHASIKPKDELLAWLAHVVGHAAGYAFTTILVGKGKQKPEHKILPPLTEGVADGGKVLTKLLELRQDGLDQALPFAPATSQAYAMAVGSSQDAGTLEEGLAKALSVWDGFGISEVDDPYLRAVWGLEGPMPHPAFGKVATELWNPYIEHQGKVAAAGKRSSGERP